MEPEMRMMWKHHGIYETRRGLCNSSGTWRLWSGGGEAQNSKLRLRQSAVWSAAFQRKRLFQQKQHGSGNLFNVSEVIYDPVCAVFHCV